MWTIYGVDSPNVTGVTNPKSVIIGDFKSSDKITEGDFNNTSNTFLAYDGGSISPNNKYSSYVQSGSFPSNLLGYNRFNILHRKTVENGQIQYEYDNCYYEWIFHTGGTNLYYFDGYNKNTRQYSECPAVDYRIYTNNAITRDRVQTLQLIATTGNHESGIGVVRPLWGLNLDGIEGFSEHPIQHVLGPALPEDLINEWLKYNKKNNPDAPVKPVLDPEDANQHVAVSAGWTWHNKFKIMNWSGPWPNKFLIDGAPADMTDFWNNYAVYNQQNDTDNYYHILSTYTGDSVARSNFLRSLNACWKNINDREAEVGHSINDFNYRDSANGDFITYNNDIDNLPTPTNYRQMLMGPNLVDIGDMDLDYSGKNVYNAFDLRGIKIKTGSKYFMINESYSNNTATFATGTISGTYVFMDPCIIRYGSHYYIGGNMEYKLGNYSTGAFVILCRIDNLQSMPNYGGPNPGDPNPNNPDATGTDKNSMDETFGDGTSTSPNATTENIINDNIGDYSGPDGTGTAGDGSAYNPDGTPRDPADYGGTGTGEKNTNPVDSNAVPNSHDGSMGNGTGDPHGGDALVTDPSSTLPSGVQTAGTASGAGILQVFTPTLAELNTFTSELLSTSVLQSIKNYFTTNPMDGIFGLHILPYTGFAGTATANPRIGTHNFTATLTLASDEFITVDYGTVYIPFVYDGAENYAPYSDAKIFLPFIGTKDIDINVIQGSQCNLKYNISLVTGDIYAYMYCQWAGKWGSADIAQGVSHLMYSWQGNCAATIPLSHLDSTNYISGAMQIAGGITSLVAGAATSNPMAIMGGASALSQGRAELGRTSIVTSGNISGMAAFMGSREPYFIISRPIVAFSAAYNHYLGQRSNAIQRIGDLRDGTFTMMRNVDLAGVSATGDELNELMSILKGGFYI